MQEQATPAVLPVPLPPLPKLSDLTMRFWKELLGGAIPLSPDAGGGVDTNVHDSGGGKW